MSNQLCQYLFLLCRFENITAGPDLEVDSTDMTGSVGEERWKKLTLVLSKRKVVIGGCGL